MNKELAFLLGAFGDGSLPDRSYKWDYTIEFDQKNKQWLGLVAENLYNVFGKKPNVKKTKKGYYRLRLYSKGIYKRLEYYRSNVKLINSKSLRKEFVKGFYDAEATVHKSRYSIVVYNKNRELIEFSKNALLQFKINPSKNYIDKRSDTISYSIYGKNQLIKFRENIGFTHPEKVKKLNKLLDSI